MTDQQHVLYRMYDVHDRLLYVGITLDVKFVVDDWTEVPR